MKYKHLLTSLLLASALLLSACNKQNDPSPKESTDTDVQIPVITDTEAPVTPAPVIPDVTEEPAPTETEDMTETEPTEETEAPIPELPTEDTAPTTEETETQPTESPVAPPPAVEKQIIDLSDRLLPGGAPVTGQVASAQSNHIRLLLDYSVQQTEDGTVTLVFDVGLSCYELWCSAKPDMGTITVNGVSRTFSTDAIDHMESEKTYIPFLSQSYNAAGGQSAAIEVSWRFNGTYGGMEIGTLTTGVILQWDAATAAQPDGSASVETAAPDVPDAPDTPTSPDAPDTPDIPDTPVSPDVPTEPAAPSTEPTDPPAEPTDPVNPTEPAVPPTEPIAPSNPDVPPAEPGEDTTPVPETPPTEPEPDPEPTVTGTPEETVPTDET